MLLATSDRIKMKGAMSIKKLIFTALGALLLAVTLTGCISFGATRESVTVDEFTAAAKSLSLEVNERPLDELEHLTERGVICSFAASRDTVSIIFSTYADSDSARSAFGFYSGGVEELFPSSPTERIDNRPTWNYHERRSRTALAVAIRIDNTIFAASAETTEDVAAVDALIAAIGY